MIRRSSDCSSSPYGTCQHKLPADCSKWWCHHTSCATGDMVIVQYHSRARAIMTEDQLQPHCYLQNTWYSGTHTVCATTRWTWLKPAPFEGGGQDKCTYQGADKSLARPTSLTIAFSVQGTGGSPTGLDPENRVGDQDTGSLGRPVSSGLQVPGVPFPSWSSQGLISTPVSPKLVLRRNHTTRAYVQILFHYA
jgi:hypothetical protein